ncbi:phosphotransferase [Dactylosporangium sp. NPDC048998]|uniref:phosphotransferase n=1 Tax=Dactylosporangium sp. NPDC048998 TaxID=3363976 RepID=UPI00371CD18A
MTFDIDQWCKRHLGSPIEDVLFTSGHLSRVFGVRLTDGREVIVKVRPDSPRLAACTTVERALWRAGFPAPEPLTDPIVEDGLAVSAEAYIPGGSLTPGTDHARRFAGLLARFVALAPRPEMVGTLEPDLPWTAWNHRLPGVWPAADDRDDDLNAPEHVTPWLDDTGARVRRRLSRFVRTPAGRRVVIGHGDWEAQNIRWDGDEPLVVHDWDSVMAAPEAVVVGLAASVWPCGMVRRAATVPESAAFLDEYQRAACRAWSADEIEASWAAGLWVYAFNTKKAGLDGQSWLAPDEAERRLALAGA